MIPIQQKPDGIRFKVYVQPRSSKNTVVGSHADALKIRLTAPPVDDAANRMCVKLLAKTLDLPKSAIEIISGRSSRTKQVLIRCDKNTPPDHSIEKIINKIENLVELKKS